MRVALFTLLSFALLGVHSMTATMARADADETRLETVAKTIDKDSANKAQNVHVQALARQFDVSADTVESLRNNKQGWGGVTIELAMARHLAQTDPKTYPTLNDALTKIDSLRADKMGWGRIANDLGFKLGPVVSAAEHTRLELVRELRSERVQKVEKGDRPERVNRPERVERPDRPQRPERPERPERGR